MTQRWLKALVAASALGVLAAPLPPSDIGSCTTTELAPADPVAFCADLRVVQDAIADACGLPRLEGAQRDCGGFHFLPRNPPAGCAEEDPPAGCFCQTTDRAADHCLDVLYERYIDGDCPSGVDDVRALDVDECGPCPGES